MNWKTISSKIEYKNPWFSVRKDKILRPDGKDGIFYVIDKPSAVAIVPITNDNEIYLIRIGRYTTKKTNWEIPIGSSDGESELSAAKRELKEETGLTSTNWKKLGELEVAAGMTGQLLHVFIAQKVKLTSKNDQLEENIDKIQKVPFKKVLQMIKSQKIVNGPSIAAITLVGLKLKLIK